MAKQITWERALVRTGFLFEKEGDTFLFHYENCLNQRLLERMLKDLGVAGSLEQMRFTPATFEVDEEAFMQAFHENRGSHEYFPGVVDAIVLYSLDPYIAGIVRWCAAIGIPTATSCDGHGRRHASLCFHKGEEQYPVLVDACMALLSGGKWQFHYQYQSASGRFMIRQSHRELRERQQERRERGREHGSKLVYEQRWLLDVAEALHDHQDLLSDVVRSMKTTTANQTR
ncbi:hypothetical protein [Brevibacillus choshinensis]|uniref:hypothetical protein n=1 Tax=Brevibacillus choshinensis TaxID=54911 RepID=UPI002E238882|nr:hypothetical protein [Brevibacillus choshinensis]